MRKLIWILLSLGTLWGGYWFVGANAVEKGLNTWLSDTSGQNLNVEYSGLNTTGFPNRFDTTIRDIEISGLDGAVNWSAPFLQIFALSYKPNHVIAVWPDQQTLTLPRDKLTLTSSRMRGSVVFKPETALTLDRSALEVADVDLQSFKGWSSSARALQFNTRQSAANENAHDVFAQAQDLKPSIGLRRILDPNIELPTSWELLRFDGVFEFDGPWDRSAIEISAPALTKVVVNELNLLWGDLDFTVSGDLTVDERGFLEGQLEVSAKNWQGIYGILKSAGLIQDDFSGAVEGVLMLMSLETADPDLLVATWVFQGGRMRFGAIPLGPAPFMGRR